MTFNRGDIVTCINDTPSPEWAEYLSYHGLPYLMPHKGEVLVVDGVLHDETRTGLLFEKYRMDLPDGKRHAFDSDRFRKVVRADDRFTAQIRACKPKQVKA